MHVRWNVEQNHMIMKNRRNIMGSLFLISLAKFVAHLFLLQVNGPSIENLR